MKTNSPNKGQDSAINLSLDGADEIAPEVLEQIWAERAAKLAQAPAQEEPGERIELLMFRLGHEVYGFDVQYAYDIRPARRITRVPRVPEWVVGVTNRRGHILSVVDLRRFFGLAAAEHDDEEEGTEPATVEGSDATTPYLVFVETPEMDAYAGLLVDDVPVIEALSVSRIRDAADTPRGLRPEYVRGIVERQDKPIAVVLDLLALLADERLMVHEEVI